MVGLKEAFSFHDAIASGMLIDVAAAKEKIYTPEWRSRMIVNKSRFKAVTRALWNKFVAEPNGRDPVREEKKLREILASAAIEVRRCRIVHRGHKETYFHYRPGGPRFISDDPSTFSVDPKAEKHLLLIRSVKGGTIYMLPDEESDWNAPRVPGGNFYTM